MAVEYQAGEEKYVKALQTLFSDEETRARLQKDPVGTLEGLGFDLDDNAKAQIRQSGAAEAELGVAAVPAVLVRVATNGTRPVVNVVTSTSTFAQTRGRAKELER